jgi:hypothetical protein
MGYISYVQIFLYSEFFFGTLKNLHLIFDNIYMGALNFHISDHIELGFLWLLYIYLFVSFSSPECRAKS